MYDWRRRHILHGTSERFQLALTGYAEFFTLEYIADWQALDEFLSRAWWSRTWTVQEIWNASHAIIQCGTTSLLWEEFRNALDYPEAWDEMGAAWSPHMALRPWTQVKQRYGLAIHVAQRRVLGARLSDLLWNMWDREATDPRDKVFAVLNLVGVSYRGRMQPDYSAAMCDVYMAAFREILYTECSLDIVIAGCGLARRDGLPSWIPDWRSAANQDRPMLFVNRQHYHTFYRSESMAISVMHGHGYAAAGQTRPRVRLDQKSKRLTTLATLVGIVEGGDEPFPEDDTLPDATLRAESILIHLWRRKFLSPREWKGVRRTLTAGEVDIDLYKRLGRSESSPEQIFRNIRGHRRFFCTTEHHGLGPAGLTKGDHVYILAGCHLPMVLRPEGNDFVLVGEAYGESTSPPKCCTHMEAHPGSSGGYHDGRNGQLSVPCATNGCGDCAKEKDPAGTETDLAGNQYRMSFMSLRAGLRRDRLCCWAC